MTVRSLSQTDIIKAANRLTIMPRTLGRKNLDEAVCILRRRGSKSDLKLLVDAGYSSYDYEHRPKSERRVRV